MRQYKAILSTTHLDKQDEHMTREDLDDLAEVANQFYIPTGYDHDPRIPPAGRIVSTSVEPIEDGHHALFGVIELWDETDGLSTITDDGRKIGQHFQPVDKFYVLYDRTTFESLGRDFLNELAELGGNEPMYNQKKATEPLSALIIASGIFIIGGIAAGFLSKLGEDVYEALKRKLKLGSVPTEGKTRLLEFHLGVETERGIVSVDIILTNPTPEEVEILLANGFKDLDALVLDIIEKNPRVSKINIGFENNKLQILFWIRDDGVPSLIRPIEHKEILSRGLSIGGIRRPKKL